jgi:predicted RNA-binding protein with RPS1 domain
VTGFEVGAVVTGTVSAIPRPGAIGLFVDLAGERRGFVDVLTLPRRPESWLLRPST